MNEQREMIDGYAVHPAASVFPLMEGEEFENLVESVRARGIIHPVVVRRAAGFGEVDELLDGRNRLRAAEEARNRGVRVDVPVVEWSDTDGRNIAEWIWDTNATRRQLTDDGIAIASAAIWPLIAKEAESRKEAVQFQKGQSGNPSGKKQVNTKSCSPARRDAKEMHASSTVGQVAAKAGVSIHKAKQAIAVHKAIEAGEVSPDAAKQVMAGKKKLRDVAPKKEPASSEPRKRTMRAILEDLRDLIAEWMNADHNVEVLRDELKTHFERIGQ